ncbi:MAG TPA: hypothetical protein VH879_07865 [Gemmatimonadales bacterium]|jgi:hypothetical protein
MRKQTLLWLLLVPAVDPSQLPAQQRTDRWTATLGITRDAFTGASSDTTTISGTTVEVAPAPRLAVEAGLRRRAGAWEVGATIGYAPGALRARTKEFLLDDRTGDVVRYRAALLVGRTLTRLGEATLVAVVGPALDHWEAEGIGNRTTVSARGGLTLRVPLGRLTFENTLAFGVGQSPFSSRTLPPEAKLHSLRTWSFGVGLGVGL